MSRFLIGQASRARLLSIAIVLVTGGLAFTNQETRSARNPVIHWNRIANEIFPVDVGPILDSRAMSILHAAIHDAVNGIERRYEPYSADLSFPAASIEAAVAAAARDVMIAMAPAAGFRIEQEYAAPPASWR